MQMTLKLEFSQADSTEIHLAITSEDIYRSEEDFIALVRPALALIRHNAQAYGVFMRDGSIALTMKRA